MMKLVMEAFMIIVIVVGMVFMSRVSASENNPGDRTRDEKNNDDANDSSEV